MTIVEAGQCAGQCAGRSVLLNYIDRVKLSLEGPCHFCYLLQGPLWTNFISCPVLQASTTNEQLLGYVWPFDPHTGVYTVGQNSEHFFPFIKYNWGKN